MQSTINIEYENNAITQYLLKFNNYLFFNQDKLYYN